MAGSLSISSFVGGGADVAPGATGTPASKNIRSRPAGANKISIFAGLLLRFLNECSVPTDMLANIPEVATICWPPIWKASWPSRTKKPSSSRLWTCGARTHNCFADRVLAAGLVAGHEKAINVTDEGDSAALAGIAEGWFHLAFCSIGCTLPARPRKVTDRPAMA